MTQQPHECDCGARYSSLAALEACQSSNHGRPRGTPRVILRCASCGNAMRVDRQPSDPAGTSVIVTNECDICEAANGGFGEEFYYESDGNSVAPDAA